MPDYNNGKIYKVITPQNEVVYIGSTTQKLCRRFAKHTHKGNGNRIILLENYSCNSREELCMKEQDHIELHENLLNQMRAYNSEEYWKNYHTEYRENNKEHHNEYNKKYYENNKEQIIESNKKWYENNKDKIKVYRKTNKDKISEYKIKHYKNNIDKLKEKITCVCGCYVVKRHLSEHMKTKKHIKLMNTIKV